MMIDWYKIMCGCSNCTQMNNVHKSYNQFILREIKRKERKIEMLQGKRGSAAKKLLEKEQSDLKRYKDNVLIDDAPPLPKPKDALQNMMCDPPDNCFPSLHKFEFVNKQCDQCKKYPQPELEKPFHENKIRFHWYETLPLCSKHGMLPKFQQGTVDKKRPTQTQFCEQCVAEKGVDSEFEIGKF